MGDSNIPQPTYRNLSDKLYDKRKQGALEIEQLVKELNVARNEEGIKSVIRVLTTDFVDSPQGNNKKGGLIALAAAVIGLGTDSHNYTFQLVPPVLRCFTDQDSRVRYYACESLYNIAKVTRGKILPFFNEIFDGLCKLSADPDPNVKNGAQLLDRLIKDIVTEVHILDIDRFIPLLQERVYVINPFCRQFLVSWVTVLDSVPDIHLLGYLPKFLDGLFNMLKDANKDIRAEVDNALNEFLREIKEAPDGTVDWGSLVKILIVHCTSLDDFTRLRALTWVNVFILVGKEKLLPYSALLLSGILPCLSHEVAEIEEAAARANTNLLAVVGSTDQDIPIKDFIVTTTGQFLNQWVPTRLSALRWVLMLHSKIPHQLATHLGILFPALLKTLSDPAEAVVRIDLEVMARISLNDDYFNHLMQSLVVLFRSDPLLLQNRGNLIICQLSLFMQPEKIFRQLAMILENEEEPEFAATMVQTLNLILLTSVECLDVRTRLKNIKNDSAPDIREMFGVLYRSWAHSPASLLSLCLLCQAYEHACEILTCFAELEMTVNFLLEIDKLVQLLESPIFTYLRLQLLEPERYPFLFKSLYGLLMILPQSTAFEILRNRLTCISSLGVLHLIPKQKVEGDAHNKGWEGIDFDTLLKHFKLIQDKHEKFRRKAAALAEEHESTQNQRASKSLSLRKIPSSMTMITPNGSISSPNLNLNLSSSSTVTSPSSSSSSNTNPAAATSPHSQQPAPQQAQQQGFTPISPTTTTRGPTK